MTKPFSAPAFSRFRPLMIDLYSCQGGASRGYFEAGFDMVGVDLFDQPRYPFTFEKFDAVEFVKATTIRYGHAEYFDVPIRAWAASPPCQRYSKAQRIRDNDHRDLIGPTRDALNATGLPWIIENVEEARSELINPIELCGCMFGLGTYRVRLFETGGGFGLPQPEHREHTRRTTKMGRPPVDGEMMHVVGNFSGVEQAKTAMGIDWMSRDGLREAIPPAYTQWIGEQLRGYLDWKQSEEY